MKNFIAGLLILICGFILFSCYQTNSNDWFTVIAAITGFICGIVLAALPKKKQESY